MSSFMKISGTLRNLLLLAILAAGINWLWQEGKLAPIEKTVKAMIFGNPPEKPKVEDFQFKPVTRQNVNQKVLATGTVTLKTGAEVKIGARISGQVKSLLVKIRDSQKKSEESRKYHGFLI